MPAIPALQHLVDDPHEVALVDAAGSCNWLELFAGAMEVATAFAERGIAPGQHRTGRCHRVACAAQLPRFETGKLYRSQL